MTARMWMLSIAVAALFAAPARAAGEKDELAKGEWEGIAEQRGASVTGGGTTPAPDPGPIEEPEEPVGTPTEPTDPEEPTASGPSTPLPDGSPTPYPGGGLPPLPPPGNSLPCPASWTVDVTPVLPQLTESQTMLTLVLFRSDAFAYICNLYARAESTWYVDWFATTAAEQTGEKSFAVEIRLVGACPVCSPHIEVEGLSFLETKAQVKTSWGTLDSNTLASAQSSTSWAAPVDCSDSCSSSAKAGSANSKWGVGFLGLKVEGTVSQQYVYSLALGGKAAIKLVKGSQTRVAIMNRGGVNVFAGGCEDNAQAKSRAGYWLRLKGISKCGPWGEYEVELKN